MTTAGGAAVEPYQLGVSEAASLIAARELSPVELVDSVLARIEAVDSRVHAFAAVTADAARDAARRAEQEVVEGRHRGPLHGVPVAVKDLYDVAGVPTTASSKVRADRVAVTDSAVVARLTEAGAIGVGKTHTHEFAYGVLTPTTRNPWDLERVPGGSSGGAGAAVAAGMCAVGMGSDTTGSIRIPAAVCGTVGLKPTYGRVSRRGVTSLSWSLDHVGPLTRTVRDAALVLAALAGPDRDDPASVDVPVPDYTARLEDGVAGLVVGVPTDYFWSGIDPAVEASVRAAIDALRSGGARLREVAVPHGHLLQAVAFGLLIPEASAYHQSELRGKAELYGEDVRPFLDAGELVLATDYLRALRARTVVQRAFRDAFDGIDVLVAPTVPATAARVGQEAFTWPDGTPEPVTNAYIRTSFPASVTGLPALSVPCGAAAGLPVGLQVIGRPFDEETVLRVGRATEQASAWPAELPLT